MNTFTIENARSTFFTSKEHYIAFRQAWKDHHEAHPHDLDLTTEHYFIYAALCGQDVFSQFTPISHKLPSKGAHPYYALDVVVASIKLSISCYSPKGYFKNKVDSFYMPFGDTVTLDMLKDMMSLVPNMQPPYVSYS